MLAVSSGSLVLTPQIVFGSAQKPTRSPPLTLIVAGNLFFGFGSERGAAEPTMRNSFALPVGRKMTSAMWPVGLPAEPTR